MINKLCLFACLFIGYYCEPLAAAPAQAVNNVNITRTTASVSSAAQVLAANAYRKYLFVQNNGSAAVYLKFGSTISAAEGITIAAGASYESVVPPKEAVYMKASSSTQACEVMEGN